MGVVGGGQRRRGSESVFRREPEGRGVVFFLLEGEFQASFRLEMRRFLTGEHRWKDASKESEEESVKNIL